eukprot:3912445-Prymnesium_polylepis.1
MFFSATMTAADKRSWWRQHKASSPWSPAPALPLDSARSYAPLQVHRLFNRSDAAAVRRQVLACTAICHEPDNVPLVVNHYRQQMCPDRNLTTGVAEIAQLHRFPLVLQFQRGERLRALASARLS